MNRSGPLGRYNLTISKLAARGKLTEALRMCAQMKAEGVQPDLLTYTSLIMACRADALHMEAWAIYEDMLGFGLSPDREIFHRLIQVR